MPMTKYERDELIRRLTPLFAEPMRPLSISDVESIVEYVEMVVEARCAGVSVSQVLQNNAGVIMTTKFEKQNGYPKKPRPCIVCGHKPVDEDNNDTFYHAREDAAGRDIDCPRKFWEPMLPHTWDELNNPAKLRRALKEMVK